MWLLLSSIALSADVAWYVDSDDDGFGDGGDFIIADENSGPVGFVRSDADCNDNDDDIFPSAQETCNGFDDDCDGIIDGPNACSLCDFEMYEDHQYAVCGRGTLSSPYRSWQGARDLCTAAAYDLVTITSATEDAYVLARVRARNPNIAYWIGLNDRDDEGVFVWNDGTPFTDTSYQNFNSGEPNNFGGEDCITTNSGADQGWNDSRCRAFGTATAFVCEAVGDPRLWWPDIDGDGFGDADGEVIEAHAQPSNYVPNAADCDDTSAGIKPGAVELCNGFDDNCNGIIDTDSGLLVTVFDDPDGDGYGSGPAFEACPNVDGLSAVGTDCREGDPNSFPGADEFCNGLDNDCDGTPDNGALDRSEWYSDEDSDGYGAGPVRFACEQPNGAVAQDGDCDDFEDAVNPGEDEVCDDLDNDCDTVVDNDPIDAQTWYTDADSDGFGDAQSPVSGCEQPQGTVIDDQDCDDQVATTYPGAPELENGIDDDCDGFPEDDESDTDTDDPDTDDPDTDELVTSSRRFDPGTPAELPSGCSCSAGTSTAPWWVAVGLFALLATVRRRSHDRH